MEDALQQELCRRSPEVILYVLNDVEFDLNRGSSWKDGGQSATEVSQHKKANTSVRPAVLESYGTIALIQRLLEILLGSIINDKLFNFLLNTVYL